jgi:parallel beta-helix repeat protein
MIGPTVYSVHDFAAISDGVHDNTRAFQCAINMLPTAGGTVVVPAGNYLIDPAISIWMRSYSRLELLPGARLITKPNAMPSYNLIVIADVTDAEIVGGMLMGDRMQHDFTEAGTHEWGHGIRVARSTNITIRDLQAEQFTGDGLSISGTDVHLHRVISVRNRRQGLTIAKGKGYRIIDCEFSHTGKFGDQAGTAPTAGIDIEPDKDLVEDTLIEGCTLANNTGCGLLTMTKVGTTASIQGLVIRGCTVTGNANGIELIRAAGAKIIDNTVVGQRYTGVVAGSGAVVTVSGNTFGGNYTKGTKVVPPRVPAFDQVGTSPTTERDILIKTTAQATVLTNHFT